MLFKTLSILSLLIFTCCDRSFVIVHQQKISPTYLASANVGSPDPRPPPNGQMLVAEWWVPRKLLEYQPILHIHILFHDFSETFLEFPIHTVAGYETYSILNEDFERTCGFLSYHAKILTCDGEVFADWKHQLFVKLIIIEDETEEMSSAVSENERQPSVIETPETNISN